MTEYKLTKTVGKFMTWNGRWIFFTFVISLILTSVLVAQADPSIGVYNLVSDKDRTFNISLGSSERMAFFGGVSDNHQDNASITFALYHVEANGSQTELYSNEVTDGFGFDIELQNGDYLAVFNTTSSINYFFGYLKLNIGLILATSGMWATFGILVGIFFSILPFWLMIAIIELVMGMNSTMPVKQPVMTQQTPPETVRSRKGSSTRIKAAEGTPFEKLTKKDWVLVGIGLIFFIGYLSSPTDGAALFFTFIFIGGAFYSYTEREKTKDRLEHLLAAYPKVTIAFASEQLAKKEDQIVEAMRIMILDEGAPYRLDLINRTITKVGINGEPLARQPAFAGQPGPEIEVSNANNRHEVNVELPHAETTENVPEPIVDEKHSDSSPNTDDTQVLEGEHGTVRQPWAYCQACGEGLVKKVKYCYSCGARQYD